MDPLKGGSIVWSRAGSREKWWPSVVFRTWEAAKDAGFVQDGIAFLVEAGRKIDILDEQVSPQDGELLNLSVPLAPSPLSRIIAHSLFASRRPVEHSLCVRSRRLRT